MSKLEKIVLYGKHYLGYTFWTGLETIGAGAIPKLILFPIAAYILGKEDFGLFLYAYGIVMLVGYAPSQGLTTGLIRHMSELQGDKQEHFVSTGVRLLRWAMGIITLAGIAALFLVNSFLHINNKTIYCLIPLILLIAAWNLFEFQMARYRVERRFAFRTCWYFILCAFMFLAIPGAFLYGAVGMAWGLMLGYLLSMLILTGYQKMLFHKPAYNEKLADILKPVWFHITIASILAFSSRYIYRIILGAFHSYGDVSVFFGATNIIDLCLSPMAMLGILLLSLLGRFKSLSEIGRRQTYTVVFSVSVIVLCAVAIVLIFGNMILKIMFPEFGAESAEILYGMIYVIPFAAIVLFTRPFVVKFAPIKFMPLLNGVTALGDTIPAILLIPKMGIKGAVISYNIGYGISAAAWLGALVWTFKYYKESVPDASIVAEGATE